MATPTPKPTLLRLDGPAGMDRDVGFLFVQLELVRKETRAAIEGLSTPFLDATLPGCENSIGQLLYHVAGVEYYFVHVVVLGSTTLDEAKAELTPAKLGAPECRALAGRDFEFYVAKLDEVRAKTEAACWKLKDDALDDECRTPRLDGSRCTPRWALTHLMAHEAHHRGQVVLLRRALASRESR